MPARDHVNVAHVDPHAFDELVIGVLEGKLEEMRERPRYRDSGFLDDDGYYHARGGIHNDRSGRAADGYTKQDVEDVRGELRSRGLLMTFDAVDAMFNEYNRTGRLNFAIAVAGEVKNPSRRGMVEVKQIGVDRYRVGAEVVRFRDRHVDCTCRPLRCEHEIAARRSRRGSRSLPSRFPFADPRRQKTMTRIAEMLARAPDLESVRPGRPGYTAKQKIIALVIARLFRGDDLKAAIKTAVAAGYFTRFPASSLKRFKKDPLVEKLLKKLAGTDGDAIGILITRASLDGKTESRVA